MSTRRKFVQQISTVGALSTLSGAALAGRPQSQGGKKIWAVLLHLGYNFWIEYSTPAPFRGYRPYLQLSEPLWNDALKEMQGQGLNMVLVDLGDAVKYESHPEIAVNNAWSTSKLKQELKKMRDMGLEPIPKLNFAAGHDTWLKQYSRMVSTDIYYGVCKDLIEEVSALFDKPRLFHLGMDEENADDQRYLQLAVIRQHDLWWHDLYFFQEQVEKRGSRAWIWSDYAWKNHDVFFKKMPKAIVQSNWYYGEKFTEDIVPVKTYLDLESNGYEQIPTGGFYKKNDEGEKNMELTVEFCKKNIADPRLLGFIQTYWAPTTEENRRNILKSIDLIGKSKKEYEKKD
jgi:hypothetical protein